jgi:hypothetical protein
MKDVGWVLNRSSLRNRWKSRFFRYFVSFEGRLFSKLKSVLSTATRRLILLMNIISIVRKCVTYTVSEILVAFIFKLSP